MKRWCRSLTNNRLNILKRLLETRTNAEMVSPTDQQLAQHLEEIFGDKEKLRVFLEKTGEDAQKWLDKLQQLIDNSNLNVTSQLRSSIFTVMIRLSKLSGLHPKGLLLQDVRKLGRHPIAAGGFGDVWKGIIGQSDSEGQLVCLKVSKVYVKSDLDVLFKEYLREAIMWRQLNHRNVLPFLGIFYLKDDSQFCLISPWMENGNLLQYLKATRRADVDHIVLACDVAAGLAYLHGEKVVHGDLKGLNVLITPEGRACIGDFGLSRIADTLALKLTTSTTRAAGTARWLAREVLNGSSGPTKESDVYAFACVCYEIFTTLPPFHEFGNDAAVILHVMSEKCPTRPTGTPELDDGMWNIMEACWNANSASRPRATEVLDRINSETLVARKTTWTVDHIELKPLLPPPRASSPPAHGSHEPTQVSDGSLSERFGTEGKHTNRDMGLKLAKETRKHNDKIDGELEEEDRKLKEEFKILLLGSGESGKSTIVKQMRIIHNIGFSEQESAHYRSIVCRNVLDSARAIILTMNKLEIQCIRTRNHALVDKIMNYNHDDKSGLSSEIADAIYQFWQDPATPKVLEEHGSSFYLMDSAPFFSEILRIGSPGYLPSETDILRARQKTTNISETRFTSGAMSIHIFDVGGQRSERRKWIHCFESVTSIILCHALSEYDQVLEEEKSQNRMQESLHLFEAIINSRWFMRTSIILFLNKTDVFKKKISRVPLKRYFPEYTGGNDITKAAKFILWKFNQCNRARLSIYPHLTQATDTTNIRLVFAAVKETVLQNAMRVIML
ncbi:Guanine nucleotide-binding protein alpha-2 subunit [Marasmius tenuissimus]|uniref:Guanine nucleotide-binding protein alpha-2 subunit n=1 Tax=Marasmius tenuissimus TaxID=585030 RepID=A0ABR2ZFX4_9AGAR